MKEDQGSTGQDYNDGHGPPMQALDIVLPAVSDRHDIAMILLAVTSKALAGVAQGIAEINEYLMNEDV